MCEKAIVPTERLIPRGGGGRGGDMVETRSKKSAASRDVAAIQQSVPSVRDVVMPKRGKADGSRPTSAASSAKSMPTTVSAGHTTESFPLATPSPSATPRRTREGGRGTRSTPSTPPSHRRLLPRSQRSPREAPGSGGHGDDADGDAASAERSIDSHVTQFAQSLRALREGPRRDPRLRRRGIQGGVRGAGERADARAAGGAFARARSRAPARARQAAPGGGASVDGVAHRGAGDDGGGAGRRGA